MTKAKSRAVSRPKSKLRAKVREAAPRAKAQPQPRRTRRPTAPTPPPLPVVEKSYRRTAGELLPIAEGHGACIASDKITVDGNPVRFMYRERAIHRVDSGWRFLSGLESDAYLDDDSNVAFYDCNTIANFDRSIVPYLDAPIGSVFEKPTGAAEFAPVTDWSLPEG